MATLKDELARLINKLEAIEAIARHPGGWVATPGLHNDAVEIDFGEARKAANSAERPDIANILTQTQESAFHRARQLQGLPSFEAKEANRFAADLGELRKAAASLPPDT